jgi:hypothetical protein
MYDKILKTKCKHKKNSTKIKVYLFFIGIFNFLGRRLELTHALFHSCLPFPEIFDQTKHFYKSLWATLVDTYLRPLRTFSYAIIYCHALENA